MRLGLYANLHSYLRHITLVVCLADSWMVKAILWIVCPCLMEKAYRNELIGKIEIEREINKPKDV